MMLACSFATWWPLVKKCCKENMIKIMSSTKLVTYSLQKRLVVGLFFVFFFNLFQVLAQKDNSFPV